MCRVHEVADLKKKVTELGLEAGGTKAELLAKVEKYLSEQGELPAPE